MPTGHRSMPVLPCLNVDRAVAFYVDKLGFGLVNKWAEDGEATAFAIVIFGKITIALQQVPVHKPVHGWSAYLYIDDAEALAQAIREKGVPLNTDVHETFYGMREFDIKDAEGHTIAFGQDLEVSDNDPGL